MLENVHEATISSTRGLDLREVLHFCEQNVNEHEDQSVWGYGDSFRGEHRFREDQTWNPVEGSEVRN